jgi:hypothetical protein
VGDQERSRDAVRRARDRVAGDDYGPDAAEEVTLPPGDELIEAAERDLDDPADAQADPDTLRDGGPTRHRGVMTTTGGRAGPASVRRRPRRPGGKVAPTTTGDATTGGLSTPAGGSTSDGASQASQVGNFTDRR